MTKKELNKKLSLNKGRLIELKLEEAIKDIDLNKIGIKEHVYLMSLLHMRLDQEGKATT